jgi:hypothetical protein
MFLHITDRNKPGGTMEYSFSFEIMPNCLNLSFYILYKSDNASIGAFYAKGSGVNLHFKIAGKKSLPK